MAVIKKIIVCSHCGSMLCKWIEFGEEIKQFALTVYNTFPDGSKIDEYGVPITNTKLRKCIYHIYIRLKYGYLGQGQCIPVLPCVYNQICCND